jgi:ABC-type bacteriocin/lantibiotic exporter with double-glycine peptidase domain
VIAFYRAIWRVTWQRQLILIVLSLVVAGLAAAPLKLQEQIINHLIARGEPYVLVWLCVGYLGVVAVSGGLKFALNFLTAGAGERVVRLIRGRLYMRAVKEGDAAPVSRGTLVTMTSAEAEGVGAFAGAAIATPVLQVGTLVSVIGFIAASEPALGLIAFAVIVPQVVIVVTIQARVNRAARERTLKLRDAADRLSASDLARIEQAITRDFDEVLAIRLRIFRLKLSTKYLQSLISAAGTAGVLLLGGWLVLEGRTDTGTVVASLSGLGRIEGPWRELVAFYRQASVMRVSYEMLINAFVRAPAMSHPGAPPR